MDERRNFIARQLNGGWMAVLCREFAFPASPATSQTAPRLSVSSQHTAG